MHVMASEKNAKKAAEWAIQYSNNMTITLFAFLQRLLIRFGVFVPIDLSIDKANLGGRKYGQIRCTEECCLGGNSDCGHASQKINLSKTDEMPCFSFYQAYLGQENQLKFGLTKLATAGKQHFVILYFSRWCPAKIDGKDYC